MAWLLGIGGAVALLLTVGLALLLTSRAATSAADADARNLAMLKTQYSAASDNLKIDAAAFQSAIANNASQKNATTLSAIAFGYASALYGFDQNVQRMSFPPTYARDVDALLSQDLTLVTDLSSVPGDGASSYLLEGWMAQIRVDYASDSAAHARLSGDLGLPVTGLPGAPSNTT